MSSSIKGATICGLSGSSLQGGSGKAVQGIAECIQVTELEASATSLHQSFLKLKVGLADYNKFSTQKYTDLRQVLKEKDLMYFKVSAAPGLQTFQDIYKIARLNENVRAEFTSIRPTSAFLRSATIPSIFLPGSTPRHGLQGITDLTKIFKVGDCVSVDFAMLRGSKTLAYEVRLPPLGKPPQTCYALVSDATFDHGYLWSQDLGYIYFIQPDTPMEAGDRVKFKAISRPEVNNCSHQVQDSKIRKEDFRMAFSGLVQPAPREKPAGPRKPPGLTDGPSSSSTILKEQKSAPASMSTSASAVSVIDTAVVDIGPTTTTNGFYNPTNPIGTVINENNSTYSSSISNGIMGLKAAGISSVVGSNDGCIATSGASTFISPLPTGGDAIYGDHTWRLRTYMNLTAPTSYNNLMNGFTATSTAGGGGEFGAVGDGAPKRVSSSEIEVALRGLEDEMGYKAQLMTKYPPSSVPEPPLDKETQTEPLRCERLLQSLIEDEEIFERIRKRFPDALREMLSMRR